MEEVISGVYGSFAGGARKPIPKRRGACFEERGACGARRLSICFLLLVMLRLLKERGRQAFTLSPHFSSLSED
ncbi:hypothetical protein [Nitrosococcus watsonii]|uniref:hypothetical protein n=1 Tax=Nitrosococcus watsonii TaxID=473531 RepID=UPI0002F08FC6|nr:hypothetical protein [Nitrosococcus watsonii]